ncbi:MAG: RDD family protein [Bifidobacteriaceae bacterium]|nr:RDD family protein [Bifidobacteriaceae bacterium]
MTDEILTSEAVLLEVRPASFLVRALGFLIDATVIGVFLSVSMSVAWAAGLPREEVPVIRAFVVALVAFSLVGLPTLWETLSRGRSLGKLALGYRILRDDGATIRFREALTRSAIGLFENLILGGAPALITAALNTRGKRIGDLLAGTYPARVRGVQSQSIPLYGPPELAPWAAQVDIGAIPDSLTLAARRFLDRAPQLNYDLRARQALNLAAQIEKYVAPRPPSGTAPERYIAAVLAVCRQRETVIYAQRRARTDKLLASVGRLGFGLYDPEQ